MTDAPTPRCSSGSYELRFGYTNWEGRNSERRVQPISVRYGQSKWHPRDGWLMLAFDLDKNEEREFSMRDMVMVERSDPIGGVAQRPVSCGQDTIRTAAKALDYLADHTRPAGGQETYNAEHLIQIAYELREIANASPPAALPAETVTVPLEALRNCGCPADFRATVGQCEDSGQCGCSINLNGSRGVID